MNKKRLKVDLGFQEAMEIIKESQKVEPVHEEIIEVGNGIMVGTVVFEKYSVINNSKGALIVTLDNLDEYTDLRITAAGTSAGILGFDWGTSKDYVETLGNSFKEYIVNGVE